MLQLDNKTPFAAMMTVIPDRAAIDTLYVIVKATLSLRPRLALSPVQVPPILADEYHGEPGRSSLKQVSEMHLGKPGTDVLLVGRAWAPDGQPAVESWVRVSVAERSKTIRVFGDRAWLSDGTPSAPQPFESMPLVWERAFGGVQHLPDRILAEERNPVGVGFAGAGHLGGIAGQPVPNLEDPSAPLSRAGQVSSPACFAPVAASWLPRRRFAGTYDQSWQRKRAPYLPEDFDLRFFHCAAPELTFDRHLQGSEPIEVRGATCDGPMSFALPTARLSVRVKLDGSIGKPPVNLETVLIEPDENRLCLTWRAAWPCDRKVLKIERVMLELERPGADA